MDDFAISRAEQKLALIKGRSCDKYDYLISVACGAAAGLIDVFLVDAPGNKSILQSWSDTQIDHLVERFAKLNGWSGKGIDSAIQWLEGSFPINYDQRYGADVNGAFAMSTRNHHLKSLAHSPDPIGLFFSILDIQLLESVKGQIIQGIQLDLKEKDVENGSLQALLDRYMDNRDEDARNLYINIENEKEHKSILLASTDRIVLNKGLLSELEDNDIHYAIRSNEQ